MKKVLPVIIVGTIVVLILISRAMSKKGKPLAPWGGLGTNQPGNTTEEKTFTGKLKDALSWGDSMICTWKKDESNFGSSSIKSQKIYTDVTTAGKRMFSLIADNCTYVWEQDKKSGFKMCTEREKGEEKESLPDEFSWEAGDINYSCEKTTIPDSTFNPPSNVKFIGPSDLIKP